MTDAMKEKLNPLVEEYRRIDSTNQLTGFYMMATLAFNELSKPFEKVIMRLFRKTENVLENKS